MASGDPMMERTQKCEQCGRRVVDASTDFGGVILRPTCRGIEVSTYAGVTAPVFVTEDELRDFLRRAYGS